MTETCSARQYLAILKQIFSQKKMYRYLIPTIPTMCCALFIPALYRIKPFAAPRAQLGM